jgi:hypothetical protein
VRGGKAALAGFQVYEFEAKNDGQLGGGAEVAGIVPVQAAIFRSIAPNPLRGGTTISYELARASPVSLRIYDLSGREVRVLESTADGAKCPGIYNVRWDGRDGAGHPLAEGVFFCTLEAGPKRLTRKLVVMK